MTIRGKTFQTEKNGPQCKKEGTPGLHQLRETDDCRKSSNTGKTKEQNGGAGEKKSKRGERKVLKVQKKLRESSAPLVRKIEPVVQVKKWKVLAKRGRGGSTAAEGG